MDVQLLFNTANRYEILLAYFKHVYMFTTHTHTQINTHLYRETYIDGHKQTHKDGDTNTDRHAHKDTDGHTDRHRQTHASTDIHMHTQIDRYR